MSIGVVIIGQTGSGKTQLAAGVSRALSFPHISSGKIARRMAESDQYTKSGLERGDWAPELAMRVEIIARIEAAVARSGGFVIEGFPRRIEQLYLLEQLPDVKLLYFHLDVDSLTCIRRLIARDRDGDHPDAVATRMRAYQEFTIPMLEVLGRWSVQLDGSMDPEILVSEVVTEVARES